jgi:hypothetical protein
VVGYTINNEVKHALKLTERTVIGDAALMFRRRSEFLYKAVTDLDCQAIRKQVFYELMEKYYDLGFKLKSRAFAIYRDLIRKPVLAHK